MFLDCCFSDVHEAILILEMQNNAFYHSSTGSRVWCSCKLFTIYLKI